MKVRLGVWVAVRRDGRPVRAWVGTRKSCKLAFDILLDEPFRVVPYEPARPKRKGVVDR